MKRHFKARGSLRSKRKPGEMSKVEKAYAAELERRSAVGDVIWYAYEKMKFKLADATWYTPDFMVLLKDDTLEAVECKGRKQKPDGTETFWSEADAWMKLKIAADAMPFPVKVVYQLKAGPWAVEEV